MASRKQSRGKCVYCGRELTRGGLSRHLRACRERAAAVEAADQGPGRRQILYHLQVRDAWSGRFWLYLEMNDSARLAELDHYLRWIWLECCDHLSRFSIGGWGGADIPMGRRAHRVFDRGPELTHIYDFGTSSHTLVKSIGMRGGKPLTPHPIALMARNNPLEAACVECDEPAVWRCIECERDESTMLCEEHGQDHGCGRNGGMIALVNSPREGMCGYSGPAEPPY